MGSIQSMRLHRVDMTELLMYLLGSYHSAPSIGEHKSLFHESGVQFTTRDVSLVNSALNSYRWRTRRDFKDVYSTDD